MENVITLGKLMGLFCSVPPLFSIFFLNSKNSRNEPARPVMGTIFLIYIILLFQFLNEDHKSTSASTGMQSVGTGVMLQL